ncbi:MAG: hypothetical protein M3R57_06945 [Chloroflexota bacterium]|nr:hypothetical protein [Chloroflexota bacterium]
MRRLVTLLGLLATVGTFTACSPSPAAPELTNPREIVGRTIQATAGLRTMAVRLDLDIRDPARPGVPQGGAAEGVLDLTTGEMSFTGSAKDGSAAFGIITADGASFVSSSGNGRWMQVPAQAGGMAALFLVGSGGVQQPDIQPVLIDLLDDAETSVELRGVEDCTTGRCYVTIVGLPPAQVWKLVVGLTGIDKVPGAGVPIQEPQGIPGLALQVVTDTATFRLVELAASVSTDGSTASVRLQVAAPNEPVSISAPPPALIDNPGDTMGGGFGFGGGGVAPGPPPQVQPSPAESIAP